ncbi:hypothetical protein D3C84_1264470 [compost metagenome]
MGGRDVTFVGSVIRIDFKKVETVRIVLLSHCVDGNYARFYTHRLCHLLFHRSVIGL